MLVAVLLVVITEMQGNGLEVNTEGSWNLWWWILSGSIRRAEACSI
jgi:hypothetical protein